MHVHQPLPHCCGILIATLVPTPQATDLVSKYQSLTKGGNCYQPNNAVWLGRCRTRMSSPDIRPQSRRRRRPKRANRHLASPEWLQRPPLRSRQHHVNPSKLCGCHRCLLTRTLRTRPRLGKDIMLSTFSSMTTGVKRPCEATRSTLVSKRCRDSASATTQSDALWPAQSSAPLCLAVHHSDFEVLIPSHSRIGKLSGGTKIRCFWRPQVDVG